MSNFAIVEIDDGFTIVELTNGESAEAAALRECGNLIDPGPYASYQDAVDALEQLEVLDDEVET